LGEIAEFQDRAAGRDDIERQVFLPVAQQHQGRWIRNDPAFDGGGDRVDGTQPHQGGQRQRDAERPGNLLLKAREAQHANRRAQDMQAAIARLRTKHATPDIRHDLTNRPDLGRR
jgi:hypothetical protein